MEENTTFWRTSHRIGIPNNNEIRVGLKRFLLPSLCLTTTYASHSQQRRFCWVCLAEASEGLIVLDKMEPYKFLIRLVGKKRDPGAIVRCNEECGNMIQSDQCMSDSVHVNDFLPPNDITQWIEREPHAPQEILC
uniref:AlNc14C527G12051 protein n=1 Tax=Albugo laibachii Nc14 TaxID=890382 RepID=F0X0W1_9STRA|nr:AlNc14C527G12051 [Albugo laibachii Nc14]|eukprot:CCA27406.1 AlNc14C527G12051 [Albugo laibachii Nc14]